MPALLCAALATDACLLDSQSSPRGGHRGRPGSQTGNPELRAGLGILPGMRGPQEQVPGRLVQAGSLQGHLRSSTRLRPVMLPHAGTSLSPHQTYSIVVLTQWPSLIPGKPPGHVSLRRTRPCMAMISGESTAPRWEPKLTPVTGDCLQVTVAFSVQNSPSDKRINYWEKMTLNVYLNTDGNCSSDLL